MGAYSQFRNSLVNPASSSPTAAPWIPAVSDLLGEPKPMVVEIFIIEGLSVINFAFSIASVIPLTSWLPSSTCCTCHP